VLRLNGVRGLLALLLAAFTALPPAALPGDTPTTVAAGLTSAVSTVTSSSTVDHRLEAHRQANHPTGWPAVWVVGDGAATGATLLCCGHTGTVSAGRSTEPHLLAFQGRAPPSSGALSVS
jgi:hypothetical protein